MTANMQNEKAAVGTAPVFTVHLDHRFQTVNDFGASACWWPDNGRFGELENASRYLDLLYSEEGLGFNVIRLNIGGCVKADRSDSFLGDDSVPHMTPLSPLKEDGTYDITRDKGYWRIVELAKRIPSITDFTLFMNTPPATMTRNGRTRTESGAEVSNLREDCYEAYAQYVAEVTELYVNAGIPVKYVSPINEPQAYWNEQHQEGCHYEPEECVRLWRLVIKAFDKKAESNPAMKDVRISVPESPAWFWRRYIHDLYTLIHNDPELSKRIDHFAAHSYSTPAAEKREFRALVDSLGEPVIPLHQTEFAPILQDTADEMDYALEVANVMYEDISILHVDHWTWWVMVNDYSWPSGLVCANNDGTNMSLSKRYFAVKHFSRFIRGKINVEVTKSHAPDTVNVSAFVSADGKETVLILLNQENRPIDIQLEGLPAGVRPMVYETSTGRDCQYLGRILFDGSVTLEPRSLTNLVFRDE